MMRLSVKWKGYSIYNGFKNEITGTSPAMSPIITES